MSTCFPIPYSLFTHLPPSLLILVVSLQIFCHSDSTLGLFFGSAREVAKIALGIL